jgi:hypothetical protein
MCVDFFRDEGDQNSVRVQENGGRRQNVASRQAHGIGDLRICHKLIKHFAFEFIVSFGGECSAELVQVL